MTEPTPATTVARVLRTVALLAGVLLVVGLLGSCAVDDDDGRRGHHRDDIGALAGGDRGGMPGPYRMRARGGRHGAAVLEVRLRDCRWVVAAGRALERSDRPALRRLGHDAVRSARPRVAMMQWMLRLHAEERASRPWRFPPWPAAGRARDRAALAALRTHAWRGPWSHRRC